MALSSFWFSLSVPLARKHTRPSCTIQRRILYDVTNTVGYGIRRRDIISYHHVVADLESGILFNESFEFFGELHVVANVGLQTGYSVRSYHEPQLERAEPSAQRDAPVSAK